MKYLVFIALFLLSFADNKEIIGTATYYNTKPHSKIHKHHSTAAYYGWQHIGKFLEITNLSNGRIDTVEVTDKHGCSRTHVDLKEESFFKLISTRNIKVLDKEAYREMRKIGKIKVKIKIL
jgi:hypothetical protein